MAAVKIIKTIAILAAVILSVACTEEVPVDQAERTKVVAETVHEKSEASATATTPEAEEQPADSIEETTQKGELEMPEAITEQETEEVVVIDEITDEENAALSALPMPEPWIDDTDLTDIAEARLIFAELVRVKNPGARTTYDSVLVAVEQRLRITPDPIVRDIVVERWISPVNSRGYQFNRRKLMLYGVDRHYPIEIFHYLDGYYLAMGSKVYNLEESWKLIKFSQVEDSVLTAYLLNYEDRL